MAQMWYDVVAREGGWAVVITPEGSNAFATKIEAYDAAVELARKLRFSGISLKVRAEHDRRKHDRDKEPAGTP